MSFSCFGVVHLLALPGTPFSQDSMQDILSRALHDASVILEAGFDGIVLENFGDAPFVCDVVEPHIVSAMTYIASQLRAQFGHDFQLGINVLRNDARAAMAIASIVEADFIRVNVHTGSAWTDQGLIQGQAYNTLMYRKSLQSRTKIAADVLVKHASPAGRSELCALAKDTHLRGGADMLILTGARTGETTAIQDVEQLRAVLPKVPIWIGSGITPENISHYRGIASGAIIGTYLHEQGLLSKPLCSKRAKEFFL